MKLHSFGDSRTRVLLAVLDGGRTVRDVAARTNLGTATTHRHLVALRAEGLVAWDDDKQSTLHPLVYVVPGGSAPARGPGRRAAAHLPPRAVAGSTNGDDEA